MLVRISPMRQDLFITMKKKNKKGIYGKATSKEILELKDEGIDTQIIPWVEDKKN